VIVGVGVGVGFVMVWSLPPQPAVAATAAVIPAPARNLRRERSSVKSLGSFFTCEASFADQAKFTTMLLGQSWNAAGLQTDSRSGGFIQRSLRST